MSSEADLWQINWRFAQSINEMTEEIVQLKLEKCRKEDRDKIVAQEMEDLKMKYYKTLADYRQLQKKVREKRRLFGKWFKK